MPTVRKGQRQVSTMALPGVRLTAAETPESRGAGLAIAKGRTTEAIGELAGTVGTLAYHEYGRMQQEERDSADRTAQNAATHTVDDGELALLYDKKTGALNLKGKDAFNLPEQTDQALDKLFATVEPTLSTPRQKQWFAQFKEQRRSQIRMTVARHVNGEIEAYKDSEFQATVKNKHSLAIASALDPQRLAQELADGEKAIQERGDDLGLGTEAISAQRNAFRSDIHVGVIDNLLANEQTAQAQHYFAETRDQIAGDKLDEVTNKLQVGSTRKREQDATATILAEGGTFDEQKAKARQLDSDIQDGVVARLKQEHGDQLTQQRLQEEADLTTAYQRIAETRSIDGVPAPLLAKLATHQPAMRSFAESLSQGIPVKTDPQTLYDLLTLSSVNPDEFLKTNLMGHMDDVGKEDLEQLMRMQTSMRSGTPKNTDGMFVSERAQNDIVDETLMKAGLVGSPTELRDPKNKALSDRIILFRQSVREAVNRQQQITGKHVTDDDMQAIVDRLISPGGSRVSKPGFFYDTYQPVFVFETDDARKAAASIPPAYLRQIDDALRRKNLPVDDAHRVELYQRSLNRSGE